jgi:hypothetical protein
LGGVGERRIKPVQHASVRHIDRSSEPPGDTGIANCDRAVPVSGRHSPAARRGIRGVARPRGTGIAHLGMARHQHGRGHHYGNRASQRTVPGVAMPIGQASSPADPRREDDAVAAPNPAQFPGPQSPGWQLPEGTRRGGRHHFTLVATSVCKAPHSCRLPSYPLKRQILTNRPPTGRQLLVARTTADSAPQDRKGYPKRRTYAKLLQPDLWIPERGQAPSCPPC